MTCYRTLSSFGYSDRSGRSWLVRNIGLRYIAPSDKTAVCNWSYCADADCYSSCWRTRCRSATDRRSPEALSTTPTVFRPLSRRSADVQFVATGQFGRVYYSRIILGWARQRSLRSNMNCSRWWRWRNPTSCSFDRGRSSAAMIEFFIGHLTSACLTSASNNIASFLPAKSRCFPPRPLSGSAVVAFCLCLQDAPAFDECADIEIGSSVC